MGKEGQELQKRNGEINIHQPSHGQIREQTIHETRLVFSQPMFQLPVWSIWVKMSVTPSIWLGLLPSQSPAVILTLSSSILLTLFMRNLSALNCLCSPCPLESLNLCFIDSGQPFDLPEVEQKLAKHQYMLSPSSLLHSCGIKCNGFPPSGTVHPSRAQIELKHATAMTLWQCYGGRRCHCLKG